MKCKRQSTEGSAPSMPCAESRGKSSLMGLLETLMVRFRGWSEFDFESKPSSSAHSWDWVRVCFKRVP